MLDPLNPNLDRGSSDYDVRHRFTVAAVWEVPYRGSNSIAKQVLGGWNIVPNFSARTGSPFSLWDCTNAGYVFCPRAMYDTPFHATYTSTPAGPNEFNYLNVGTPDSTYVNAKLAAAGNPVSDFGPFPATMTGRNVFVGPGNWNVDFAVHKNFRLTERFSLQLRAETFNVFNHSNMYLVYSNTDVSVTNAVTERRGVRADNNAYSTVSTDNRNLQLAVKLLF